MVLLFVVFCLWQELVYYVSLALNSKSSSLNPKYVSHHTWFIVVMLIALWWDVEDGYIFILQKIVKII